MDQGERPREWARDWTATVGRAIAERRKQRGLSAERVSQLCTRLGYPIPRSTITNLENGRKELVSVQEVAVLAAALESSPIELLYPIGLDWGAVREVRQEVLPDVETQPFEAAQWFSGLAPIIPGGLEEWGSYRRFEDQQPGPREHPGPLSYWRGHQDLIEDLEVVVDELVPPREARDLFPGDASWWTSHQKALMERRESAGARIRRLREYMVVLGIPLPPLPPRLAWIDHPEGESDGER